MDVELRSLRSDDAGWIHAACQDPAVQEWTTVPRPYTFEHAQQFVTTAPVDMTWAITGDGHGIGTIGVHAIDPTTATADIGYWVGPAARRRGAASTAIRHLAALLHDRGVRGMRAVIADANEASQRTVAAVGFVRTEQTSNASHNGEPTPGHVWWIELS